MGQTPKKRAANKRATENRAAEKSAFAGERIAKVLARAGIDPLQLARADTLVPMVDALRRNDQVITQGGLIGKVTKVKDDDEVEVELADGVRVRVVLSTIASVISKTEPAKDAPKDKKGKSAETSDDSDSEEKKG